MIQRYVCAGGVREGRGVVVLSAVINSVLGLLFLVVGVALFVFYAQPGGPGLPDLAREDQILPHFVASQAVGTGLVGLLLAGLFAAAMSTVDSGINGVASVVVFDWLDGRELSVNRSRLLTLGLGTAVIGAALLAPRLGDNVLDIINTVAGTLLGGLLAVFLLGMFSKRTNAPGVLIVLAAGALALAAVILWTGIPKWWYGAFTIFPTLIVGALASRWFPPPDPGSIDNLLWRSPRRNVTLRTGSPKIRT